MIDTTETIWEIHAGATGDADSLFKKGYIALGWDLIGDLLALLPNRESIKEVVAEKYPHFKKGAIPNAAGQMFRFTHEANIGDLVIYRSKYESIIHIGQITGEYQYQPALEPAYPHVRPTNG